MTDRRLSEFKNRSVQSSKLKKQREKRLGGGEDDNIQGLWNKYKRYNIYM